MMSSEQYVSFDDVFVLHETPSAILCALPDDGEYWVPKSLLSDESEVQSSGDEGTLVVPAWWARQNHL
jgi:hypothetical protein